jgi:hypothetical protein
MTEVNKQTTATLDDTHSDGYPEAVRDLIGTAEETMTVSTRTVGSAFMFAMGAMACKPDEVPDTEAVRVWLHKTMHSTYMTGRMSGVAGLLGIGPEQLMAEMGKHGKGSFMREFVKTYEGLKTGEISSPIPTDALQAKLAEALRAVEGEPAKAAPTVDLSTATVHEMPDAPADGKSEADMAFDMVSKVIKQHPTARISLDGLPAGVESRLKAAFPDTRFIELDDDTREQMERVIEQHKANRSKLN